MNPFASKIAMLAALLTLAAGASAPIRADPLPPLSQNPLNVASPVPPMNMLVMGRDRSLYNEAYNDASDLTDSGAPDVGYKPDEIDYYGYFDSFKCYTYGNDRFSPAGVKANKQCSGQWSGDFLNYVTTARIDALRRVLYGGKRSTDTASLTILERSFIPQDAHGWAKDYRSVALDGYDISLYTPLSVPTAGRSHVFANVSLSSEPGRPLLRVMQNFRNRDNNGPGRSWEWASIESPVLGDKCFDGANGPNCSSHSTAISAYTVRVEVCNSTRPESNCRGYGSSLKPEGLLQRYGTTGRIEFGLISGSYLKNTAGGVLRKPVGWLDDEIDPNTGAFTSVQGIIRTIDAFRIVDYTSGNNYHPGWANAWITSRPINEGEFPDWGNPIGEMVYESVRYFAGLAEPTSQFTVPLTNGMEQVTVRLGDDLRLPVATWDDPYANRPMCTKAAQLVISNTNVSHDTDTIPGSAFSNFTSGDLPGFDASAEGAAIWAAEGSVSGGRHFIGQSGNVSDGAPTVKTVTSLGNIRGIAPEEPTKLGGYYAASAARYGLRTDLRTEEGMFGRQNLQTFSVALASPLPKIEFPTSNGLVSLVPFGKVINARSCASPLNQLVSTEGSFQPMAQIVDFYIDEWANTHPENSDSSINQGRPYTRFRINYEDVEQGADHDMDSIVGYEIAMNAAGQVVVRVTPEYVPSAGCLRMNFGYVISGVNTVSGTTADGLYLEVRGHGADDWNNTTAGYFLNTPPGQLPGACAGGSPHASCANHLPPVPFATFSGTSRTFVPSGTQAATVLPDPLWYAAKYGAEANADLAPGVTPDNYLLVTNAALLETQLTALFDQIAALSQYAGGLAASGARTNAGSMAYIPSFDTNDWSGDLLGHSLNPANGAISVEPLWRASERLPDPDDRKIFTRHRDADGNFTNVLFTVNGLGGSGTPPNAATALGITDSASYGGIDAIFDYLRGSHDNEQQHGGPMRDRSKAIGDIFTQPVAMGRENYGWGILPGTEGENYRNFLASKATRTPVVFVGANDGMLHAFRGTQGNTGGEELFAYVPWAVQSNMGRLIEPSYAHQFYVNGPMWLSDALLTLGGTTAWRSVLLGSTGAGGRSVFALDVTNPDSFDASKTLWEFTSEDDEDLGYTLGQARLVRLTESVNADPTLPNPGRWVVIFGNGYYSDNHGAALFVLDAATGTLLRKFDVDDAPGLGGTETQPNGLAAPFVAAGPGSVGSEFAYAGDLKGNVWRFNLIGEPSAWTVSHVYTALDPGGNPQSITGGMDAVVHPEGGVMLNFGTGRYFAQGDNAVSNNPQVQTFYGIWDRPGASSFSGRNNLVPQHITGETTSADGTVFRQISENPVSWRTHRGWFLDLRIQNGAALGERYVTRPEIRLGNVYFPTFRPIGDECEPAGRNFLMVLNALTGSPGLSLPPGNNDGCSGSNCGGASLPGGPPAEPPPIVVIEPPGDGVDDVCQDGDPDCDCPADDPDCMPGDVGGGTSTGFPDNVCGYLMALVPGMDPLPMVRPCGRQSWRQLR